jgi:beta-glucanase (GH16 family)
MNNKEVSRQFLAITLVLLSVFSCSKGNDPGPGLSIQNVSQVRSTTETTLKFHLLLNKPATGGVSVDYTLTDGTAVSPGDYISAAGTITFSENQNDATIDILIKGNPLNMRQTNLQFTVNLSNLKNCTINTPSANVTIITEDGTYLQTDNSGYTTPLTYPGYTLVWSDEFSGTKLDLNTWNQESGNGNGGWGNNELEYYTNNLKNNFLSNGNLIIEARRETIGDYKYSSGRMTTQDKKFFKFGRIDIRAKLPVGKGIWPALWMLGTNINSVGWPACGEIDNMELIGIKPSTVYGTMHWRNAGGSHSSKGGEFTLPSGDFSNEFHVFSIIWAVDSISWYIDDQKYLETSVSDTGAGNYPFNSDQFFIFNVAVGGNWPGPPDNTTAFPQRMFVDYVRVFQ